MSKIMDLYAIENNIDDLIPPRKPDLKQIAESVAAQVDYNWAMEEYWGKAEFEDDVDEDGHKKLRVRNFAEIGRQIAECVLDMEIQNNHIDLTDEEYKEVMAHVADIVTEDFADEEEKIVRGEMERYKEAYEDFLSYNNLTLPR